MAVLYFNTCNDKFKSNLSPIPENTASLNNPDVLGIFLILPGDLEALSEANQRAKSKITQLFCSISVDLFGLARSYGSRPLSYDGAFRRKETTNF